jgi:hypothetical protein
MSYSFSKKMHVDGFVHGDIRALSIVFAGNKTTLIDYDFGGTVEQVEYPPGYKRVLPDGGQQSANAGEAITFEEDTKALRYVLGDLHVPADSAPVLSHRTWNCMRSLDQVENVENVEKVLSEMEKDSELEPCDNFQEYLTRQ